MGMYRKILDTDSAEYWGSNCVAQCDYHADDISWQGQRASINLTLPPLSTILLVPADGESCDGDGNVQEDGLRLPIGEIG